MVAVHDACGTNECFWQLNMFHKVVQNAHTKLCLAKGVLKFFQQQSLIGNVDIDLKNWSPLDSSIFVID